MCGRFVLAGDLDRYADSFSVRVVHTEKLVPSYNVAPTDRVYGIAEHDGERRLGNFRWGLLPHWAKHRNVGRINARVETILDTASFRESFLRRRCLVPADGFYEWERLPNGKLPHYLYLASGDPMALAGIWSRWRDPANGDTLTSCAILTMAAGAVVAPIHGRMPVILDEAAWDAWLDPDNRDPHRVRGLLTPGSADRLTEHPVASLVNSVRNNLPECILPLDRPPGLAGTRR